MGRSAKNMKRPTKADKVSRQSTSQAPFLRSPSPTAKRSAIPLFNTSRRSKQLQSYDGMSLDSSAAPSPTVQMEEERDEEEMVGKNGDEDDMTTMEGLEGTVKKKKSMKDKVKSAKDSIRVELERSKEKLAGRSKSKGVDKGKVGPSGGVKGVLGGVDYLKLHEKRPGSSLKKRFR